MEVSILFLVIIGLFLFVIKGTLMVFRPESHFFLDRWLRGDKRASQELTNPKQLNLQWRIAGLIFIAVAVGIGKVVLSAIASRLWER